MTRMRGLLFIAAGLAFSLTFGWVVFPYLLYGRTRQPLAFSHRTHTGEKGGMGCGDCHPILEDGRFAGIPPVAKCAECHQDPLGSSPEEKLLVEEYVRKGREIPWLVYSRQPDNVYFSHAVHLKLGRLECERCHGPHGTSDRLAPYEENRLTGYSREIWGHSLARVNLASWEGKKMTDCAGCHRLNGKKESCQDCHK
jgi:hypothetical protein